MTFEEFKSQLTERYGKRIIFREVGANGWTSIAVDQNGLKLIPANPGPHWCDVSFVPPSGGYNDKLVGKYDFNKNIATFFEKGMAAADYYMRNLNEKRD